MSTTVSEKGQVTIPKKLRDRLGLRPGDEVEFGEEAGRLVLRKVAREHPVDRLYGILGGGPSSDERVEELRGPADTV